MKRRTKLILSAAALAGVIVTVRWGGFGRSWVDLQFAGYEDWPGASSKWALFTISNRSVYPLRIDPRIEVETQQQWRKVSNDNLDYLRRHFTLQPGEGCNFFQRAPGDGERLRVAVVSVRQGTNFKATWYAFKHHLARLREWISPRGDSQEVFTAEIAPPKPPPAPR